MMSHHIAEIFWSFDGDNFTKGRYSRGHRWEFDGGITVPGSASPHVVPLPWSVEAAVDPEEAFVAAIASCHMLSFLHMARDSGWQVTDYQDRADGLMGRNAAGREAILSVVLEPVATFRDRLPTPEELADLHHRAHDFCFIANSVSCTIETRGIARLAG